MSLVGNLEDLGLAEILLIVSLSRKTGVLGIESGQKVARILFSRGQVVKGVITNITDFGIFLEIEDGVEGLVHISEIAEDKVQNLKEFAKVGEQLEVLIISIDKRNRKIGLSLRELRQAQEEQEMKSYMNQQESSPNATLGDVLRAAQEAKDAGSQDKGE